jgi:hypothetical protein
MSKNDTRPGPAAPRNKVHRRDARLAREELAAGGLSHKDQRRLRAVTRAWELASRRRHLEFRHLVIAVVAWIAVLAVTGVLVGFIPAIEAANGNGTAGTFVVTSYSCYRRTGCGWVGTFEAPGEVVPDVTYQGILPASTSPGSRVPAQYPGEGQVYALRGSHTWALDLIPMLLISTAAAFLVWLIAVARQPATSVV